MKKVIGILVITTAAVGISMLLFKQKVGNVMLVMLPPADNFISNVTFRFPAAADILPEVWSLIKPENYLSKVYIVSGFKSKSKVVMI